MSLHRWLSTDTEGISCIGCGVTVEAPDTVIARDSEFTYTAREFLPFGCNDSTAHHHFTPDVGGIRCEHCLQTITLAPADLRPCTDAQED